MPLDQSGSNGNSKFPKRHIPLVVGGEFLKDRDFMIPATTNNVVESRTDLELRTVHEDPSTNTRTVTDRVPLDKFQHIINLEAPLPRPQVPLVLLGTAFGSSRVLLTKPENHVIRDRIRSSLVYSNDVLDRVVENIASKISQGAGSYIGIHLRVGDGFFQNRAQKTVQNMVEKLEKAMNGNLVRHGKRESALRKPLHVYLSTDAKDPATNGLLEPLRAIVDRIYTLDDFHADMEDLSALDYLQVPDVRNAVSRITDRYEFGPSAPAIPDTPSSVRTLRDISKRERLQFRTVWMPFLDQMVASRGYALLGTQASTFTGIMERLHSTYWTKERVKRMADQDQDGGEGLQIMNVRVGGRLLGKV
jgi:hypothetical protein